MSRPTTSSSSALIDERHVDRGQLLGPRHDRHRGCAGHLAAGVRRERRRRRVCLDRGGTEPGARHRGHHRRGPRAAPTIDQPNLYVKIPATAEGLPSIQQMHHRRQEHQRHAAVQPGAIRRGDRGLPRRVSRACDRRPVEDRQRGVVLREPGRHRGRQAAGADRHRAGARPPRQGGGGERPARRTSSSSSGSPDRAGTRSPPAVPGCSVRCGRRRRRRTRRTRTRCTWTTSSGRTR